MERAIAETLQWAGDHGGAFLWRRICRDLSGGLRIGVAARDAAMAQRLIAGLDTRAEWVILHLDASPLGIQDRLLGVHALLWVTPVMAPLGSEERQALEVLVDGGAPSRAAVVLGDWNLLERMSDDPEAEGVEVMERASALLPAGWELLQPDQLNAWTQACRLSELVAERRVAVGRVLLADAQVRIAAAVDEARSAVAEVDALLGREDEELEQIRARGQRAATHLLSAVKRQTQQLQVDLGEFLAELEHALPNEISSVEDVALLRHALPHWLQHVVERWLGDRLADWRAAVSADLAELPLTEDDLERAELLVPAVQPPLITGERDWTTRLGATAAIGSGAALLLMGMWAPALLFVGGGLGFSALRAEARKARSREALLSSAAAAVRGLGPQLTGVLADQLQAIEDALGRLGDERAQAHRDAQHQARTDLERQATTRRDRLAEVEQRQQALVDRIEALRGAAK